MDPRSTRTVGASVLGVTQFGFGGVPVGDPDYETSEEQAQATLSAAYDNGVRFFDTAPWYGNNKSEHRIGHFLRQKPRDSYVLSTKVGRLYRRPADPDAFSFPRWAGGLHFEPWFDYSHDAILRSYEDSLFRLGINTVDALVIHDLDPRHQKTEENVRRGLEQLDTGRGFRALADMRARGEIKAIGAGVNHLGMIPRFLERFDIDYFLLAMPYTLMDQPALDSELPLCEARGAGIVIGAVFASGILATGPGKGATYGYQPAEAETVAKVEKITAVCRAHGVSVAAAALQFPLAHPTVAAVIPGANHPDQVTANLAAFRETVPAALWSDLKAEKLIRPDAPVPAG